MKDKMTGKRKIFRFLKKRKKPLLIYSLFAFSALLRMIFLFQFSDFPGRSKMDTGTGFKDADIVSVKGTVLSRPQLTSRGDTGINILLTATKNRRGWESMVSTAVFAVLKGDLSTYLMVGDSVDLTSCRIFGEGEDRILLAELLNYSSTTGIKRDCLRKREKILIGIETHIKRLPFRSGNLFSALILGRKGELDPELKKNFSLTGCSHLLALSGFHVSILMTMLVFFGKRTLGERITLILTVPVLLIYLIIAGLFPSLIRAVIMSVTGSCLVLSFKDKNKSVLLAVSLFLQIMFFPQSVISLSFFLSYGAVCGIFFYSPVTDRFLSRFLPYPLSGPLSVSIGAQLINIPLIFRFFGAIYPIGILVQMIVTPLITLFVWFGFFYLAVALFSLFLPCFKPLPLILSGTGFVMEKIYILIEEICQIFSGMSFLGIYSFAGCCIFFFVLLIPLLSIFLKKRRESLVFRTFCYRL